MKRGPRKFYIFSRSSARNFSKSHKGPRMVGISHTYLHDSHQIQGHISSYLLHIPSNFFISSLYFCIFLQNLGPKEGGGGKISRDVLANFIFTPGVEIRIFPSPTETYDWSEFPSEACDWLEFPTEACDWSEFSKNRDSVRS